jgi:U6 snRNA-associated Sm-like protein LSm3
MILGDVEETVTSVEIDDSTYEEIIRVRPLVKRSHTHTHAHACARPWTLMSLPPLRWLTLLGVAPTLLRRQTNKRQVPFLYVRGDGVILVSPPIRS